MQFKIHTLKTANLHNTRCLKKCWMKKNPELSKMGFFVMPELSKMGFFNQDVKTASKKSSHLSTMRSRDFTWNNT